MYSPEVLGHISIETRTFLEDEGAVESRLNDIGAEFVSAYYLSDEFYGDLKDIFPQHTFEKTKSAARLRIISENGVVSFVETIVKEVPPIMRESESFHDVTKIIYFRNGAPDQTDVMRVDLKAQGFPDFITTVNKNRKIFKHGGSFVHLDNIETRGFGWALEICDIIDESSFNETKLNEVKVKHLALLETLGMGIRDLIKKSYTHLLIDADVRSNTAIKKPYLEQQLATLEKERTDLMLESEDLYREGGDGWHDNSAWDTHNEKVKQLDIRIANIKQELFELPH